MRPPTTGLIAYLETSLDKAAEAKPNPGRTEALHRLNRAEYRNAVRDLLALDIDVSAMLPADDVSYGFDNIAGVQRMSPTLMERYLGAAEKISGVAVGASARASDDRDVPRAVRAAAGRSSRGAAVRHAGRRCRWATPSPATAPTACACS